MKLLQIYTDNIMTEKTENLIILSKRKNIPQNIGYSNGVLSYDFSDYKFKDLGKLEKKMESITFQIVVNNMLRNLVYKEDLEQFKMVLPYWKMADIGFMTMGHPFLHELFHQYEYSTKDHIKDILKYIFSNDLARKMYTYEKYIDKYGFTPRMRSGKSWITDYVDNLLLSKFYKKYNIIYN